MIKRQIRITRIQNVFEEYLAASKARGWLNYAKVNRFSTNSRDAHPVKG
jgi:hypothetical protein